MSRIGKMLIGAIEEAQEKGLATLQVNCAPGPSDALHWHKILGFALNLGIVFNLTSFLIL